MMNITVTIDDETYRRVHARAAELNTSVDDIVQKYLASMSFQEHRTVSPEEFERLERLESEITKRITNFNGGDRLPREQLYDRKRS